MNLYEPLKQFLLSSGKDSVSMTFSELEKTLGFVLPKSAYDYKAWWANGGHSQAQAWLNAGYKVKRADCHTQTVCFYRSGSISKQKSQTHPKEHRATQAVSTEPIPLNLSAKAMTICGYEFRYLQQLMPELSPSRFSGQAKAVKIRGNCKISRIW